MSHSIQRKTKIVGEVILNTVTNGNINRIGKIRKAMITTKKKKIQNLPTNTNNEYVYILGDSIVKHVEGWKLNKLIRKQSFTGAKVKCIEKIIYSM